MIDHMIAINDLNAKLRKKDEEIASLNEKLDHAFDSVQRRVGRAYVQARWLEKKTGIRVPKDIGYESLWQSVKDTPPTKEDANEDGMVLFAKREYCDDVSDKMFWDMCSANYDDKFALEDYTHWMYIPVPYTEK